MASGKTRGGGLCIFVNNSCCTIFKEVSRFCSPGVEYLMISCRPYYLPREFSSVFVVAVHHRARLELKLNELYSAISQQETAHPEATFFVDGYFIAGKLKSVFPNFYQHVKCATRGTKTPDHLYSTHRDAYQALPRPPIGKYDHNSILLIPAYKQKLKQEVPETRSIRKWSEDADNKLQDCFAMQRLEHVPGFFRWH